MSATQTVIGGTVLVGLLTLAVDMVTPAPPAIVVHDLHYEDGIMFQDRTVSAEGGEPVFYAFWTAKILDAETNVAVCSGEGAFPYAVGRRNVQIELSEWVGEPCDLPPGTYRPVAAWSWGYDQTSHAGHVFTIEE